MALLSTPYTDDYEMRLLVLCAAVLCHFLLFEHHRAGCAPSACLAKCAPPSIDPEYKLSTSALSSVSLLFGLAIPIVFDVIMLHANAVDAVLIIHTRHNEYGINVVTESTCRPLPPTYMCSPESLTSSSAYSLDEDILSITTTPHTILPSHYSRNSKASIKLTLSTSMECDYTHFRVSIGMYNFLILLSW